ncbi:MAG: hypothetical protein HRT36_06200 [Alphaproteobacteria bacterium]|nr:hypothetical protein [Alphaproteobacteria bacterium]
MRVNTFKKEAAIPERSLENIFNHFYSDPVATAPKGKNRNTCHTGLDLSIVKQIYRRLQNGTISASNRACPRKSAQYSPLYSLCCLTPITKETLGRQSTGVPHKPKPQHPIPPWQASSCSAFGKLAAWF